MDDVDFGSFVFFIFFLFSGAAVTANADNRSTYIVHVLPSLRPSTSSSPLHWYSSTLRFLPPYLRLPRAQILYAYDRVADGFAARLTDSQASFLRRLPHVVSVLHDRPRFLHTTSPPSSASPHPPASGLSPIMLPPSSLPSWTLASSLTQTLFVDHDLPSPPSFYRSSCAFLNVSSDSGPCNNKLVGAKFFYKGYEAALGHPIDETIESKSPLDTEGHGTHTSSTAAGAAVPGASFLGYAPGVARGIATKARIAAYKICWAPGCFDSDILAAMDAAVADGANVISLSVGSSGYSPAYYRDSIAIGAFGAARHGVVVSCSAGNSGPYAYTAVNIAPWIITVGASTIDREFPADVILGDGRVFKGVSLYSGEDNISATELSLVYAGSCGSRLCLVGLLDPAKVAGKIVLCERGANARVEKGSAVKLAGGAGMILANSQDFGDELIADSHLVPATMVGASSGVQIRTYILSSSSPTASIVFRGTVISGETPAPKVAAFSSRGPNYRTPEILKPDVIAPG
ncbi:hypothetical protein HPP92_019167 [Vanilla planifolia]|uniref:Subtilisin-like protease n=1 Tax=Vanilla planifolia TaxID=51239 RepID=A0A835UMY2_VANPL|nr:hypothetical protein HPP92_019167 [Vanilla planifolia]